MPWRAEQEELDRHDEALSTLISDITKQGLLRQLTQL